MKLYLLLLIACLFCTKSWAQADVQKRYQTRLIMVENGGTVDLDQGTFTFTGSLSLEDKKRIVIRGKGIDKTILSFKGQTDGAEGLRVSNAEEIVIENLTVQDTKGDGIKTMNVKGITFRNVKVEWTGPPKAENGGYGLYPVQCDNVVIDGCTAIGASDAGIYVGQSRGIVVKKSKAYHNVAGIEIENSRNADVFDNEAYDNTGGILVFDLPDLVQKQGGNVRVFNNYVHDNNLPNFAPAGNIVASVSDGTGLLILAANGVEVFNNRFIRNQSVSTGIISYLITELPIKDKAYYPFSTAVSIHDNVYERKPGPASSRGRYGKIFESILKTGQDVPHILYDGIADPATFDKDGKPLADKRICIRNNKNQSIVNLDAGREFKNVSFDAIPFNCQLEPLKTVTSAR
ncbi:parallel beta-helix domain-containing protein [Spirosoma endophyticum]|uniref:Parallel beta-helix repeat-containing protein n=1 Tax=Spirosoma endophyticum TaxID=662367 RepID=A0A1I1TXA5_9BACT|nr:parallel beta-helix domain-containing protein [Spirosoma endophyticum]SFD63237.1 parallel beta-helix repeat-containing protein [Spirosoma endophyticum]